MATALANKRVLLGVTGGIAAYKSAELVRRLQDAGATVRVVMTRAACEFVTPLTFQALSGHPVHTELLDPAAEAAMGHIELARWADLVVVAPASADFLARLAAGEAGDLLTAVCLATPAPVVVAPAMNQGMWRNPATQHNLQRLAERGTRVLGPDEGQQACGDVGPGRMLEPTAIVAALADLFPAGLLAGVRVVVTAGPTREPLDPVRFLSNRSSGKMGYAIAAAAAAAGARVLLISGPTALACPDRVERIEVETALEMYRAALAAAADCQLFVAAAAVADYRPARPAPEKIKKEGKGETLTVELVRNPDIVAEVAALEPRPVTVGFAAETSDLVAEATRKLHRKKLDAVVANDVSQPGIGFDAEQNAVTFITAEGCEPWPAMSKTLLAERLVERFALLVDRRAGS
ncbi:MAG: phosphopantothenoylcysteine decarboxylase [Porticoccaceae bacterium]|nr:MAG: phosphopantothenoylcysteine decarboxylase [Porticoccaceae bacterium]